MNGRITVVYIAGAGRSGSTLLARMLGQVPSVFAPGEVRNLLRRGDLGLPAEVLCSCGEVFAECPVWTSVRAEYDSREGLPRPDSLIRLVGQIDRIRYLPAVYSPWQTAAFRDRLTTVQQALSGLYRSMLRVTGASVIVDGSKDLSLMFVLARMPEIDLRVLHMVRDARAVAYSRLRRRRRIELLRQERYLVQRGPLKSAGDWWYRNLGAESTRTFGVPYHRIRYEDFVAEPERHAEGILHWLGLRDSLSFIDGRVLHFLKPDHQAGGNPSRFAASPVEIREDDRWRQAMPPAHRRMVTLLTWPLLLRYEYALGPPGADRR